MVAFTSLQWSDTSGKHFQVEQHNEEVRSPKVIPLVTVTTWQPTTGVLQVVRGAGLAEYSFSAGRAWLLPERHAFLDDGIVTGFGGFLWNAILRPSLRPRSRPRTIGLPILVPTLIASFYCVTTTILSHGVYCILKVWLLLGHSMMSWCSLWSQRKIFAYLIITKSSKSAPKSPIIVFCKCHLNLSSFDFCGRDAIQVWMETNLITLRVLVVEPFIHWMN